MLDGVSRDIRFGVRMLVKSPGFTAVAVLSLALGIGANTTIFTLINAVRLKMLPVENPSRLVLLQWVVPEGVGTPARSSWGSNRRENGLNTGTSFSYPAYEYIRDGNQVFSGVLGFANLGRVSIASDGEASRAQAQMITGGAFEVLGERTSLGRTLSAADDLVGAPVVAVISDGYWHRQFGGDRGAVGKTIAVNGQAVTIAGVTAPGFTGVTPGSADEIWMPLRQLAVIQPERVGDGEGYKQNSFWWVVMMARLKPEVSLDRAQANIDAIFRQHALEGITATDKAPAIPSLQLVEGGQGIDSLKRDLAKPLSIMMTIVLMVALIACANVANLLLARAAVRQKEIAVRLSLGTSRGRLVRQLLTESALLAVLGAALGVVLAFFGSRLLLQMMDRTGAIDLSPDGRVLAFTTVAAVLTTFLFGLAPALRATAIEPFQTLRESAGGSLGGKALRLARVLVVGQVALSVVLLSGASVFVRTLNNLRHVNAGFETSGLLLFGVAANQAGYKGAAQVALYERIQERLDRLPGVTSSTMSPFPLLSGSASNYGITVPGYPLKPDERLSARVLVVGDRFFETMRLPLLFGRALGPSDGENTPPVAVANQAFVKKFLGGSEGLGRTFTFGKVSQALVEIVGVSADAKYDRLRGEIEPTLYVPMRQNTQNLGGAFFEVRTARDPLALVPDVRRAVAEIHPGLPLDSIRSQEDQIDRLLLSERLFAMLTTFFGLLALALVCVGVYGIVSYGVAIRTTEIGVRMAIGARARDILSMVLGETTSLVARGVLIGLPIAFAIGRFATTFVASLLYGVESTDPVSLGVATFMMTAIGSLAGILPARRASAVAPMTALRCE